MAVQYLRIQVRRDSSANWSSANPVLLVGEVGFETDTKRSKTGDGVLTWSNLAYDKAGIVSVDETSGLDVDENGVLSLDYDHTSDIGDLGGQTVKAYVDAQDTATKDAANAYADGGDSALQAEIDIIRGTKTTVGSFAYADETEYIARTNADNMLDGKISANITAITAEKSRAEAAEALLTTQVGGAQGDATAGILAASTAQATADGAVTNAAAAQSTADGAVTAAAAADAKAVAAQADADANASNVSILDGRVTTNEGNIGTNTAAISTNTTNIAINATDIASIDADKYDKSEVDTLLATKLALSGGTLTGALGGTEGVFSVGVQGLVVRGESLTDLDGDQVVDCKAKIFKGTADAAFLADSALTASAAVTSSTLDNRITAVEDLSTAAVAPSADAITVTNLATDGSETVNSLAATINILTVELAAILNS